jgi:hypothetical protein
MRKIGQPFDLDVHNNTIRLRVLFDESFTRSKSHVNSRIACSETPPCDVIVVVVFAVLVSSAGDVVVRNITARVFIYPTRRRTPPQSMDMSMTTAATHRVYSVFICPPGIALLTYIITYRRSISSSLVVCLSRLPIHP